MKKGNSFLFLSNPRVKNFASVSQAKKKEEEEEKKTVTTRRKIFF